MKGWINPNFDVNKAIRLYKRGMRMQDICRALGYRRGHGYARTRLALERAGVWGTVKKAA